MFYRVTNAVIAPDLIRAFNLDAEQLGMLGSAFFYTFALFQIPMGLLLDRIGPRRVISFFVMAGASGAFVFVFAGSFYTAVEGRALLGMGMASVLMGSLKVFATRYPPRRFATLSGMIVSIGTLGTIFATTPLAYLNSIIGWRAALCSCGIITVALAVLIFLVLTEEDHSRGTETLAASSAEQKQGVIKSSLLVLGTLSFWQIGSIAFFRYGTFVALQGVWLGPYLMEIKRFTPVVAGNILMMLSLGSAIGSFMAGYLADRVTRSTKSVIMIGMSCYALSLVPLTGIWKIDGAFAFSAVFVLIGFFSGFGMLAYVHIKELFPLSMSGTVIAGVNFFVMAGGAFFMQLIGVIIMLYGGVNQVYSPGAYHMAFLICLMGMIAGLIFYSFSKSSGDISRK
jgi:MFS family permease